MERAVITLLLLYAVCLAEASTRRQAHFVNFEDYLVSVSLPRQHNEVLRPAAPTQTANQTTAAQPSENSYVAQILAYFRDVPRQHWSCCMVGMLAGNKGFHCQAHFYAARIQMRNYNRAHSRVLPLHTESGRMSRWGLDIMRTFRRCVTHSSNDFHKCCYAATVEQRELSRWAALRNGTISAFDTIDTGSSEEDSSEEQNTERN